MGSVPAQRSFFLPPFHKVLPFQMGERLLEQFHTLPDVIPLSCTIRTSDNVQVKVDMRISFQVFEPEMYTKKPVDFYRQVSKQITRMRMLRISLPPCIDMRSRSLHPCFHQQYARGGSDALNSNARHTALFASIDK